MAKTNDRITQEQVRAFGKSLEREIAKYPKYLAAKKIDLLETQRIQVNHLFDLEEEFKATIRKHSRGLAAYQAFVVFIRDERRNILHARPYFRERSHVFTDKISPLFKARDAKKLMGFRINFRLVDFLFKLRKWPAKIKDLYRRIIAQRNEICVTNMPLVMSRARIFWSKTPESHLGYLDLTQIAAEGLLAAIDKFEPPFTQGFRGVAIGRMTGNMIERASETLLHFFPDDKQKLYRGHKASRRAAGDLMVLANEVNMGHGPNAVKLASGKHTNADEMSELLAASSCVSTELSISTRDSKDAGPITTIGETLAADESWQPDVSFEASEQISKLHAAVMKLSVFDRKVLKLKGISV